MSNNSRSDLLTAGELAEKLKLSKQSIYSYTRKKLIPVIQIGRHFRYDYSAVLNALNDSLADGACTGENRIVDDDSSKRSFKTEETDHVVPKNRSKHGN